MTDEELAGQPGALATRAEGGEADGVAEPVFSPKDFRLNLGARLAGADEEPLPVVAARLGVAEEGPLPNLDSPSIRKLMWEHVVPDLPASSAPSAATTVPLPPPRRVPPPPPRPVTTFQPPAPVAAPEPIVVEHHPAMEDHVVSEDEIVVDDEEIYEEDSDDAMELEIGDDVYEEIDDHVDLVEPVEVAEQPPVADVQPEVNRLALVPDLIEDDDTPVELPPITPSGPMVVHEQSVYAPVLAETLYIPPPARVAATMMPVAAVAPVTKKKGRKPAGKPKRHLFRTFMTLVLLFGLLAGGAFAAKKYLLQPAEWAVEIKPIADQVAAARGLEFKAAVEVTPLPVADYASRLARSTVDTRAESASTWRALGLLNGELDLEAIGRQALSDSPAFYDPATKTVLIADDLQTYEHLYRFALHRALTAALLDQQFEWSSRAASASPAAAFAIRATIDGDALAVANALALNNAPDQLAPELLAFVQGHASTVSPSQYAATITGRAGVATLPATSSMLGNPASLAALEQTTPSNDAVLDIGRPTSTIASPPDTHGMMFWYYVLASRIDDGQAWSAAVRWSGDSLTTAMGSTSRCVDAKVGAADPAGAAALLAAFQAWAATAPVESTTTVTPIDGNQVAIRACDPGATVSALLPAKVPVVFGGAAVERALVQAATRAAGVGKLDGACLVNAARQRGTVLASPADDSPVIALSWQPAYVAANLDLATGCIAAP